LNFVALQDNWLADEFEVLSPYYNVPDQSKPYSVSGNLTLHAPGNSIIANYLSDVSKADGADTVIDKLLG